MTPEQRKKLEALVYRKTHKDFKGSIEGKKNILVHRGSKGTCLVNLEDLTEQELLDRAPKGTVL